MKPSSKTTVKSHIGSILYPILYTLFLFLIATVIYFYANGYRFNIFNREFTQTGVIGVDSTPAGAEIYVDDKLIGKTPKSASLEIGSYHVTVKKEGYYNWVKDTEVVEGKSTPLYPWLIKQNPVNTVVWTSAGTVEKYWVNAEKNHILFLTKEEKGYTLWEYTLNPALWDFSPNPSTILQLENNNVDISMSPNGQQAILTITTGTTSQHYLINTQILSVLSNLKPLNIDSTKTYTISWSKDNSYLLLDSAEGIFSYNITLNQITTLLSKVSTQKYIWTTDEQGFFYVIEPSQVILDSAYSYRLKQIELNGTNAKYIIDNFYFQKTDQYIKQYRESGFPFSEFFSSPESTLSAGEVSSISVNQEAQGAYINTTLATYWFNIRTQKFILVSAYPSTLVEFNPNHQSLIFQDPNQIAVFTFDKVEGDHTVSIGSKIIKNIVDIGKTSNIHWLSNALNITYLEDSMIYIADNNGDNKSYITKPTNLLSFLMRDSKNTLLTFTKDESNKLLITEFEIH